jgi:hypothetical protein
MVSYFVIPAARKPAYVRYWFPLLGRVATTSPSSEQSYLYNNHHVLVPRSSLFRDFSVRVGLDFSECNSWSN